MKTELKSDMGGLLNKAFIEAIAAAVVLKMGEAGGVRSTEKRLLSLKEAGKDYLGGKSSSAVRNMIAKGIIPPSIVKRLGDRRVFLFREELDKWLSQQ